MAEYVIVNKSERKMNGKITYATRYYCGVLKVGNIEISRWDSNRRKDAYVFENKESANRYFNKHKLGEKSGIWAKISWDCHEKDNYMIIKLQKGGQKKC